MSVAFFGRVPLCACTLVLFGLVMLAGCSKSTEATTTSSADELSRYMADHPELDGPDTQGDGE